MARYYGIPRDNKPETKNIVACEKYWSENYPAKLDYDKERQEMLLLYLHALNKAKFQNYYSEKEVPLNHSQKHFLEKTQDFQDFSVEVITHLQ